ncbi:hypothetical protein H109_05583 [Trichophyton interdigitale MR816]|uniref:Probable E3 ubiquitin ligase complex SCF subunit sconB n=1 Tax=Trichophyton interdigitale (strain MR816) TaxID=1215338 RepID=A0A059J4U7_TRIIM|nr:hypothetical protein H101_01444 [Trichophyton interdigitale H6]KDB22512.1 hypothetical protein H109_05583 [Trichophyton interdigitale MR816]
MSCCTSNANPGRRRSTLRSKVRPLTSAGEHHHHHLLHHHHHHHHQAQDGIGRVHDGSHRWLTSPFTSESNQSAIIETDETLAATAPRSKHRHSKSFSSILHGASELKTITRSLSISIRNKGKRVAQVPGEQLLENQGNDESKAGWFRSHRLPRRRSLGGIGNLNKFYPPVSSPPLPSNFKEFACTQRNGELVGGAVGRKGMLAPLPKGEDEGMEIFELAGHLGVKLALDSESGISINIQDTDDNAKKLDCIRKDPVSLPAELMAHILSFLDADSLKNAELVSRSWNVHASSSNVWREVFYREYRDSRNVTRTPGIPKRAMGLGRKKPAQDWKKVYKVRHTLENRWKTGKAAAIYLHGHQDSVYCVQFDENKIITGSRDRTIRVWDARYPWPCLKVIGAHQATSDSSGVPVTPWPITPPADSTGSSPFISICPPVASTADLISHHESGEYHNASILCLQFDDRIMVTGSSDASCIVWDMQDDYRPIRRLKSHQAGVLDVCFDDKHIVSCSKDTTICVWDRETGQLLKRLLGHRGPVNAVQLRGDLVVSASGDGVAKLWNISSGLCIKEFASKDRGLACVEFSEDARTILAGGNDQVIYQFDANTGELVKELEGHSGLVRSLHMDNVNGRVISGSYDMSIKVFDAKAGKLSVDLPGWTTSWMLSAKSDYRRIVATSQDARAVIMDFGYGLDGIESLEG